MYIGSYWFDGDAMNTYVTQAGESIAGIALRRLANETRWAEIRDLNAAKYPDMVATDYYPVGTSIELPDVDARNISEEGQKLLKSLEQEATKRDHAEMLAKRQAEIAADIVWWRKQEKIRVEGFNIVQTDPMYVKMNERQRTGTVDECYKEFIAVPLYQFERAKNVLRKYLGA